MRQPSPNTNCSLKQRLYILYFTVDFRRRQVKCIQCLTVDFLRERLTKYLAVDILRDKITINLTNHFSKRQFHRMLIYLANNCRWDQMRWFVWLKKQKQMLVRLWFPGLKHKTWNIWTFCYECKILIFCFILQTVLCDLVEPMEE